MRKMNQDNINNEVILIRNGNNIKLSLDNLENTCRSCLVQGDLANLFNTFYDNKTLDIHLKELFSININNINDLPSGICETCLNTLVQYYNFAKRLKENDSILQQLHTMFKSKIKTNNFANSSYNDDTLLDMDTILEYINNDKNEVTNLKADEIITLESEKNAPYLKRNRQASIEREINEFLNFNTGNERNTIQYDENSDNIATRRNKNKKSIVKEKIYVCKYCNESFKSLIMYRIHLNKERKLNRKPQAKTECRKCHRNIINMEKHLEQHEFMDLLKTKCEVCKKDILNIAKHRQLHCLTDKKLSKEYECEFCDKKCLTEAHLEAHKRVHTGERPFNCKMCERSFVLAASLKTHLQTHEEQTQSSFNCDVCGKSLNTSKGLSLHSLIHKLGEYTNNDDDDDMFNIDIPIISPNFVDCEKCNKKFKNKALLKLHMVKHTGERPFKCQYCNKSFTQNTPLRNHVLVTHKNEKKFTCEICLKVFAIKSYWVYHMKSHSVGKNFNCELCPQKFKYKISLNKHILNSHK